ncbi:hypothetical protein, partial [Arthrobacter sp. SDTb3-6]|uniref:hypothetical protein n=1 Tax=Arthrobacter sp. SDTb3-6 TaxID=2713571 RepID=UPI001C400595
KWPLTCGYVPPVRGIQGQKTAQLPLFSKIFCRLHSPFSNGLAPLFRSKTVIGGIIPDDCGAAQAVEVRTRLRCRWPVDDTLRCPEVLML